MLICAECGAVFERAEVVYERHGLDTPPYEERHVCPKCGGASLHPAHHCDVCGEWITGGYVRTVDGLRICDDCCTRRDVEDD